MLNLVRMNLYRILKSKSTWIFLLIGVLLSLVSSNMVGHSNKTAYENLATSLQNGNIVIIVTIILNIFIGNYFSTGFIKNISGKITKRSKLVFSFLLTSVVLILGIICIYSVTFLLGYMLFAKGVIRGAVWNFVFFVFAESILITAFISFMILIILLFKNQALSITFTIIYILIFDSIIFLGLDSVAKRLHISFSFEKFSILDAIYWLPLQGKTAVYLRDFILAVVFFGVSSILSIELLKRRDLR